jgi:hypothetical protein
VEIWRPTNKVLAAKLSVERTLLRSQIQELQYRKLEEQREKELNTLGLPEDEKDKVRDSSLSRCEDWFARFSK